MNTTIMKILSGKSIMNLVKFTLHYILQFFKSVFLLIVGIFVVPLSVVTFLIGLIVNILGFFTKLFQKVFELTINSLAVKNPPNIEID